jgi:hypothetical protein
VHDDDPAGVARSSKTMQLGAEAPKQELSHLLTNPAMLFSIFFSSSSFARTDAR